jgi:hypothetical protein
MKAYEVTYASGTKIKIVCSDKLQQPVKSLVKGYNCPVNTSCDKCIFASKRRCYNDTIKDIELIEEWSPTKDTLAVLIMILFAVVLYYFLGGCL